MREKEARDGQIGGVNISGGTVHSQNIAGRDIVVDTQISTSQLSQIFQPVTEAIRIAPSDKQPEAIEKLESLKQEVAKGNSADQTVITKLVDGIVDLVPSALKSLASAFATPLLTGVAGPVTQFLLKKLLGQ